MPKGPKPTSCVERIERHANELRDGECWTTDYVQQSTGYVLVMQSGTNLLQHRIAWEAHNAEPIPDGMVVMHTCDNPSCFNPEHLVLGTQSDNIRDCVAKGRHKHPLGKNNEAI